jgi:hypothetical protein
MNIVSRKALRVAAGLIAVAGVAALARPGDPAGATGPNLVTNGNFSAALSGWNAYPQGGTVTSSAGHAVIDVTEVTDGDASVGSNRCVTGIVAGNTYQISVDVQVPPGQKRAGMGAAYVNFNNGANCNGGITGGISSGQWAAADLAWHTRSSTMVAPANTKSAVVGFSATRYGTKLGGSASDPYEAWIDNVSLITDAALPTNTPVPPTGTPVPPKKTPAPPTATPTAPPYLPPVLPPGTNPWTDTSSPTSTPTVATPTSTPVPTATPPTASEPVKQSPATAPTVAATSSDAPAPLPPQTGTSQPVGRNGHESPGLGIGLVVVGALTYVVSRRARA